MIWSRVLGGIVRISRTLPISLPRIPFFYILPQYSSPLSISHHNHNHSPHPPTSSTSQLTLLPSCLPLVDFDTFSRTLNRPGGFRDPGPPEEYCRGFQVFDKEMTGFIGVGQLRYILTNLGEKMSDEEVDELLKVVDVGSGAREGEVNYLGRCGFLCCENGEERERGGLIVAAGL